MWVWVCECVSTKLTPQICCLLAGSLDYTIRIYDFNGMKSDMKAFRWVAAVIKGWK
jgi:hypothetical protein